MTVCDVWGRSGREIERENCWGLGRSGFALDVSGGLLVVFGGNGGFLALIAEISKQICAQVLKCSLGCWYKARCLCISWGSRFMFREGWI
jgi:hypothetical protein